MIPSVEKLSLFNQVRIDPEVHTLVWPNGADFDPATSHDWDENFEEMKRLVNSWEEKIAESVASQ
ncbi:MAG: DUF2442 domain-containing protein [bacterium]|nr:MAG: DUF2442 domain-containing protein [bacterium]